MSVSSEHPPRSDKGDCLPNDVAPATENEPTRMEEILDPGPGVSQVREVLIVDLHPEGAVRSRVSYPQLLDVCGDVAKGLLDREHPHLLHERRHRMLGFKKLFRIAGAPCSGEHESQKVAAGPWRRADQVVHRMLLGNVSRSADVLWRA